MSWPQASLADYASADPTTILVVVVVSVIAGLLPLVTCALILVGLRALWRLLHAIATGPAPRGP